MFCSSCGTKLPDHAKFCRKCGSAINQAGNEPHPAFEKPFSPPDIIADPFPPAPPPKKENRIKRFFSRHRK